MQSDIVTRVVGELDVALSEDELRRLQASPTDNALAYDTYLQALHVLPEGHGSEANYRKAEKLLEQAVDPELPDARFALGDYYYRRRDYERSMKEFAAVYEVRPNDSRVLSHIAYIWRRQGLFEQCRANLERAGLALERYPDPRSDYPASFRIRQAMYEEDYDEARRLISNLSVPAISMQGGFQPRPLLAGIAASAAGDEAEAKRHFEEAVELLERESEARPTDHRVASALGLAYAGAGRADEAIRAGKRGMELLPYSSDDLLGVHRIVDMARIHAMLGQNEEALEYVKLVVSRPNDAAGAVFRLGSAFEEMRKDPRFWDLPPGYHVPRRREASLQIGNQIP